MGRPKNPIPKYAHHKPSGRARCRWTGPDGARVTVWLGPYGSPESKAEYARVVARFKVAGQAPVVAAGCLVAELWDAFDDFARQHYRTSAGVPTSEVKEYSAAYAVLREAFAAVPAAEFGPLALQAVRQLMIGRGWCRRRVNKQVGRVKRVFKWGVANELVPAATYQALAAVQGLQLGRSAARETDPVGPVAVEHVEATLPELTPTVRGMVLLQLYAGLRPGSVRGLKPGHVERSGAVWVYRPPDHKTAWRGRDLAVPLGPKARALVGPLLDAAGEGEYVFSPARSREEMYAMRRAARKCPVYPSSPKVGDQRKPAAQLRRRSRGWFTDTGYAQSVRKACRRAGVPPWHPGQLRHTFATEVRRLYGLEACQVLLGHAKADVTQTYALRNLELGMRVAEEIG